MSNPVSVGDLARATLLRQASGQLKSRLATLTQEAATGLKADVPAATNGQMGRLAQVQARLSALAAHGRNAALAQAELGGLQAAMGGLEAIAADMGPSLQTASTMGDDTSLSIRAREAGQDFRSAVRLLNTDVGGRYLLSGTAVDRPPLSGPEEILAAAKAQVAGLISPADIASAIGAWFDAPAGAGGFADSRFHGNTDAREVAVSPDVTVRQDLGALDPSFRGLLKGLAMAALADDADLGMTRDGKAALLAEGGRQVSSAGTALTARRAEVGLLEETVERASTRNAAETTAMSLARSDILAADPYETATALTQAEANLQNLYALTARLSRLSLTDYL